MNEQYVFGKRFVLRIPRKSTFFIGPNAKKTGEMSEKCRKQRAKMELIFEILVPQALDLEGAYFFWADSSNIPAVRKWSMEPFFEGDQEEAR